MSALARHPGKPLLTLNLMDIDPGGRMCARLDRCVIRGGITFMMPSEFPDALGKQNAKLMKR